MPRLIAIDPATATGEAKELLDGIQKKLGVTPNVIRTMANAPAVLKAYLAFGDALAGGRFDTKSREAIALTVAGANNCEYCASAHTAFSKSLKVENSPSGVNPTVVAPENDAVRAQLDRIISSQDFAQSLRMQRFLSFIVENALNGESDSLKEYTLAVDVYHTCCCWTTDRGTASQVASQGQLERLKPCFLKP